MKKYERPEIKEVKLDLQPILAGSDVPEPGPIGEDWQSDSLLKEMSRRDSCDFFLCMRYCRAQVIQAQLGT